MVESGEWGGSGVVGGRVCLWYGKVAGELLSGVAVVGGVALK